MAGSEFLPEPEALAPPLPRDAAKYTPHRAQDSPTAQDNPASVSTAPRLGALLEGTNAATEDLRAQAWGWLGSPCHSLKPSVHLLLFWALPLGALFPGV